MGVHYYFSWFEEGFPDQIREELREDIIVRDSLVLISGNPEKEWPSDLLMKSWFQDAEINFNSYQIINYSTPKNEAIDLLKKASVIFLCGGYADLQNQFLVDYELMGIIKNSDTVVMGASAGAINMSSKWLASKNTNMNVKSSSIFNGIGMDDFYFCTKVNQRIDDLNLLNELALLSKTIRIYLAINEVAIRMENTNLEVVGEAFCLHNENLTKVIPIFKY